MKLTFKAISQKGKITIGELNVPGVKEAISYLHSKELIPISIKEKNDIINEITKFLNKANEKDLIFFTRQISSMLSSGLTILQALNILKSQDLSISMQIVIKDVISQVEEGKSFSESIKKHNDVFSPIYVSLVGAAESSGLFDVILLHLAENLEKQSLLKSTIRSALAYPVIVIVAIISVIILMTIFVIPQLSGLYKNLGVEVPLSMKAMVLFSTFLTAYWPLAIGLFIVISYLFARWIKTENGRKITDDIILKMPIIGIVIRQSILTEFTRTLGLLVNTGSLIIDSLNQAADIVGNIHFQKAIIEVSNKVEKGVSLGEAMSGNSMFPKILVEMVRIGEHTGKVDESLTKVSEYFEREVQERVKTLTTAMEPVIMIVLGIGVAFLIISVITPIYSIINQIK